MLCLTVIRLHSIKLCYRPTRFLSLWTGMRSAMYQKCDFHSRRCDYHADLGHALLEPEKQLHRHYLRLQLSRFQTVNSRFLVVVRVSVNLFSWSTLILQFLFFSLSL